jgi:membrane protein YdbS with pleckstrin-like domain
MVPLVSIYVGGILTLLMAVFHTRFYGMFNWANAFGKVGVRDARVLYTVHLALLLLFFAIGAISIVYAGELGPSVGLAFGLNVLLCAFWTWRLVWQFTYFKSAKGRKRPVISVVLIIAFFLLATAYLIPPVWRFL